MTHPGPGSPARDLRMLPSPIAKGTTKLPPETTPGRIYPSANLRASGPRPAIVLVHSRYMGVRTNVPLVHSSDDEQIRRLRSEEHTSELQSRGQIVCRLLL